MEVKKVYTRQLTNMKKLFTGFVLLLPVFNIYASPIEYLSIGELLMFLLMFLLLADRFMKDRDIVVDKNPFWIYLIYALAATLISSLIFFSKTGFEWQAMGIRVVRDSFYFIIIMFFGKWYFDFKYARYLMRKISIILGIFIFFQFFVYRAVQIYVPNVIPMLKTTVSGGFMGYEIIEAYSLTASLDGFVRAAGFFSEPAVVAQYMSVSLLLELFPEHEKTNIKLALFYSAAMILTFSVNAYVGLAVCWGLWGIYSNKNNKKALIRIFSLVVFFAVIGIIMIKNSAMSSVLNRLIDLKNGVNPHGSSAIRVLRGIAFYYNMPLFYQIFGSGFGNFLQFKELYKITTIYEMMDEYMNTNAYILVSSGIIGFSLFVASIFRRAAGRVIFSKMLIIIVLMYGMSSSIYSSAQFVIMLLFIMYAPKKGEIYGCQDNYTA